MAKQDYHYETVRAAMNRTARLEDKATRTPAEAHEMAVLIDAYPKLQAELEEQGR